MNYSSGNYEAFVRPRPAAGVEHKHAWIVGGGLAGMAAAVFLIRDAGMPGANITILEKDPIAGGAMDGLDVADKGFVIRGGREMESRFECLWDLFRSIPSLEIEGASVLDEYYWLNKDDPNYSLQRATINRGQDAHTGKDFTLSKKAQKELLKLFMAERKDVENVRINEWFSEEFFESNFWLYWRTMFAFEEWHSALEMKLYLHRFVHHIEGLPDFSTLKFTKYNQYESLILPMQKYLQDAGVQVQFDTVVTDVDFEFKGSTKTATRIEWIRGGEAGGVDLTTDDEVFMTIGSLVDNSDDGDRHTPAKTNRGPAPAWDLWKKIARKSPEFGRPEVFCSDIDQTKWMSATVTTSDPRVIDAMRAICKRDPLAGRVTTGGIVTARDSNWLMSWTVNRQPHFKAQRPDQVVVWVYGLLVDAPGDYVRKPMSECTGDEIAAEWLYHMGVPLNEIDELAEGPDTNTIPVMMPYVTSFFMPRQAGDRPLVVPAGAKNFAFLGQFAETTRDCVFTTELSVRTAMEAVYTLLNVERAVPEVAPTTYDVRTLLKASYYLRDRKKLELPGPAPVRKAIQNKVLKGQVGRLVRESGLMD